MYYVMGQFDEAHRLCLRAINCDPLNTWSFFYLGRILRSLERFSESEQAYQKALELSPDAVMTRYNLAILLTQLNRHDEAIAEIDQVTAVWARLTGTAIVYFRAGKCAEADAALEELLEQHADHSATQIGMIYAVRGDIDAAFLWMERSYVQRDSGFAYLKTSWMYKPMHNDPRWAVMLNKLGFKE